ncbi:ligand-binding sensor domain-containing protein [Pedobacter steynii]
MNKFLFILSILIGTVVSTLGQSYTFRHYQVENGLSYNSVICSLQDKKGFLWFGTKDGLNRFDGYTFKIFRNDPDNPKSIGNNFIHSLYEDKDQNIWVGTLIGLYRYNPLNESFDLIEVTKNRDVRDIKLDSKGNIWYIAGLTLCKYNEKSKKLKTFDGRIHSGATSLSITANDEVWVSTTDGFIQKYKETKDTFENYNVFINSNPTISSWIEKLYDTGKGFFLSEHQTRVLKHLIPVR